MNTPAKTRTKKTSAADKAAKPEASRNGGASIIGERIRERRKELGMGLQELAEKTDLTASFLSLVERNLTSPSLDSLIKISGALDVPFFYFTRSTNQNPIVRRGERTLLTFPKEDLTSELLVPNLRGRLEVCISRGKPNTGNIARIPAHDSEEVIYVLKGCLRVRLHETDYEINEGDSIYFHLSALREIHVQGKREATWITAITPPVL